MRDVRWRAAGLLTVSIIGIGAGVHFLPDKSVGGSARPATAASFERLESAESGRAGRAVEAFPMPAPAVTGDLPPRAKEVRALLQQASADIAARRYDKALMTLNRVRPLDPENPEAFQRIGEALLGRKDYATARDFFAAAIDRNPRLSGAYFGFAIAAEGLGDLELAMGAMRSYLHLEPDKEPGRLPVAQARSALWEWEAKLGRGPWGPTKGIPPGFSADELKRDGKGTAVKIPKLETLRPDGTMDYEIKAGDRFPDQWRK